MSTPQIPDHVLDLAPWSTSMAGLAITCPFAFDLKYRQKEKGEAVESPAQTVGTVVHMVLELVVQQVSLAKAFRLALEKYDLTHNMQEEVLTFRDAVEDFMRRVEGVTKQFDIVKIIPEKRYAITPSFAKTTFFDKKGLFRGVIDLIMFTRDGKSCLVLDHKTGAHKPIVKHQDQLEGYSVILKANFPKLARVQTGLHYVGGDLQANGKRTVWARPHDSTHITTRLQSALIKNLTKAADSVQSDEPRKGWMCNFCGYKHLCPLYK